MNIERLLLRYSEGSLSPLSLASYAMGMVTEENAESVLSSLPDEALTHVKQFVLNHKPEPLFPLGGVPVLQDSQVAAIAKWVHRNLGVPLPESLAGLVSRAKL